MDERELLESIEEPEVVKICQELVRLKSVNPPGDERPAAEFVAGALKQAGAEAELIVHSPTRASVLARLRSPRQLPALLYNAHLDTVPVGAEKWTHDPFEAEVADGRIWGRGAADMKSGLAALIVAMRTLAKTRASLRGDLILAATAGEESDSLGAIALAARPDLGPVQALAIPEPSSNDIYVAEKGAFWLELTTRGRTAHGSMPALGRNAVMMMVALIGELEKTAFPYKEHPMLGGFSRSINTIAGGVKTNVVPDLCVATVDMRTVPGQDHQAILRQVESLISGLKGRIPDFQASVKIVNDRPPVETSPGEPAVQRFADVVAQVTGERPVPKGVQYYTDAAAFVPRLKAPVIICGPGNATLAHQPN
ncbi:MAG TPA: M20 family metallopeptidase, partial [Candidatus Methylomirabilis sp.]|nr:M20 family metallopeptidase [Candidatus Methylomirabilis sp.]